MNNIHHIEKCPICGNCMLANEVLVNKANVTNVIENKDMDINRVDLTLYKCKVCGHGAIDNFLAESFYEEFCVSLAGFKKESRYLENSRTNKFKAIIERLASYGEQHKKILEIGSGVGYLLKMALNYYDDALGIEPSKTEAEASRQLGLKIINDYFSPSLNLEKDFSAVISTMVFEHIQNVKETVDYIYGLLIWGGVGMIQVPNAQRTDFGKIYYDIYPQHLQYFTPVSLAKLIADAGFEIISLEETHDRNYLEIYFRKTKIEVSFNNRIRQDVATLNRLIEQHYNVAVWGASYAARSCISVIEHESIKHLFDVSEAKIGKYINDLSCEVEFPDREKVVGCDLILIMANEYSLEILNTLEKLEYHGEVTYFDSNGKLQILTL